VQKTIYVFLVDFLTALAGGLATSFFVEVALLAGAFLAAAFALVADDVPVTDFLAAPRLEGAVVFLVVAALGFALAMVFLGADFFTLVAFGFSASAFFGGAFLVVADRGLAVAAFVVLALDAGLDAGLVAVLVVDLGLVAGLVIDLGVGLFSLVASVDLDLGANLTLPERPLGRTKMLFCSPEMMALDNWVAWAAPISSWYSFSTYFLI